ncbi:MAG: hypothetical protein U0793_13825 [Gemmataceae bacterium]
MKRFALFVLAALFLWCGMLPSQTDKEAPRAPSRVAFVNVGQVFKRYSKATKFKAVLGKLIADHAKEADTVKRSIREMQTVHDDPVTPPEDRMKLEPLIRADVARLDKLRSEIQTRTQKLTEDNIIEMYKDLDSMCKRSGEKNGFTAVLGYGDLDADAEELFSLENVERKTKGLDHGSLTPLYVHRSFDVTERIVAALNEEVGRGKK